LYLTYWLNTTARKFCQAVWDDPLKSGSDEFHFGTGNEKVTVWSGNEDDRRPVAEKPNKAGEKEGRSEKMMEEKKASRSLRAAGLLLFLPPQKLH
jgi:hypothetical protein